MFRPNTLFVLGAGASCEAQMPSGNELKSRISRALDFTDEKDILRLRDAEIQTCLRDAAKESEDPEAALENLLMKASAIWSGMPLAISIDNFLDAHRGDKELELVGKLAIARIILLAESNSPLMPPHPGTLPDMGALGATWFVHFFQLLTENVPCGAIGEALQRVSVINFNYDRTFAYFLTCALDIYYGIDSEEAAALVAGMTMIHPYGNIGKLDGTDPDEYIMFGRAKYSSHYLPTIASQIRTFGERIEEQTTLEAIKGLFEDASTIVFLGFGFHRQNVELIRPTSPSSAENVYASCMGISNSDRAVIRDELRFALAAYESGVPYPLDPLIAFFDGSCAALLDEFRRTLTEG